MDDETMLLRVIQRQQYDFYHMVPKQNVLIDKGCPLSFYNGERIDPEGAYKAHRKREGGEHLVIGIKVKYFKEFEENGLRIEEDGILNLHMHDAHVSVDWTYMGDGIDKRKMLRDLAKKAELMYDPESK